MHTADSLARLTIINAFIATHSQRAADVSFKLEV